jgi:hypothetical protein
MAGLLGVVAVLVAALGLTAAFLFVVALETRGGRGRGIRVALTESEARADVRLRSALDEGNDWRPQADR